MLDVIFKPDYNGTSIASMIIDCLLLVSINDIVILPETTDFSFYKFTNAVTIIVSYRYS